VPCCAVAVPGGLKGRGALASIQSSERALSARVRCSAAVRARISRLSDRERTESFRRSRSTAGTSFQSERVEDFRFSLPVANAVTDSERVGGLQHL